MWTDGKDVEALYEGLRNGVAKIRNPPSNYPWAPQMQVEDLDGNVLRMGSDTRPGEPTGDWLDRYGVRCRSLPGSGYQRVGWA